MLLTLRHSTTYSYEGVAAQIVQILRLTPRSHEAHRVLDWRVSRSDGGALPSYTDGLGNICHLSSVRGPADAVTITAEGRVETDDVQGVVSGAAEPLPPGYFLRTTPLSAADDVIADFARETIGARKDRTALYELMTAVHARISYVPGQSDVDTSASEAFAAGRGVCQDQAHIFIAAARALGIPARYAGGYVWPGEEASSSQDFASHAWAEAFTDDAGWVGFDPSNGVWTTTAHLRTAHGLDYRQAAPISGVWRGAGEEDMSVDGTIQAVESSQ